MAETPKPTPNSPVREQDDPLIGKNFKGFIFKSRLGRGAFGVVYLAPHPRIGRDVAIKYMELKNAAAARLIDQEVSLLAKLSHPRIVRIEDHFPEDNFSLILMQYVSGGNLRQKLNQIASRQMDLTTLMALVEQISTALDYLHAQHILHLDLKPENIMVEAAVGNQTPNYFLTDFGVARIAGKALPGLVGTPRYMAPEQFEDSTALTPQADIYALGVMLYELLVGFAPFRAVSVTELGYQHRNTAPIPPSTIVKNFPRGVEQVILTALAKQPTQRFDRAGTLNQALQAAARTMGDVEASTLGGLATTQNINQLANQYALDVEEKVRKNLNVPPLPGKAAAAALRTAPVSLAILSPEGIEQVRSFEKLPFVAGRAADADLVLEDGNISRRHFEVNRDASGRLTITDLGSRNHTYLDGQMLEAGRAYVWVPGQYVTAQGFALRALTATDASDEETGASLAVAPTPAREVSAGQFAVLLNQVQAVNRKPRVAARAEPQVISLRVGHARYLVVHIRPENTPPARYRLKVLDVPNGINQSWVTLPAEREIMAGEDSTLQMLITAPKVPPGVYELYLGIQADHPEVPETAQIVKVVVEPTLAFDASMNPIPVIQRRFRRASAVVTLSNRGTYDTPFLLEATGDPYLRINPHPAQLTIPAGQDRMVRIRLAPRLFARRQSRPLGYQVFVRAQTPDNTPDDRVLNGVLQFPARRGYRFSLFGYLLTLGLIALVIFVAYRLAMGASPEAIARELIGWLEVLRDEAQRFFQRLTENNARQG